jgi:DNA invertase Pin-like site-specific DNA recombinase
MRVAIYCRVSTGDGRQSPENQRIALREFCARQEGWEVTHEYTDEMSGGRADRQQFQRMFEDASKRRFDTLLFWSLDRLTREGVLPTLQYLTRLSDYGVAWRSFTEPFLDSTGVFRDAVISILATIAKQEKIRISERTRAGLERARRRGATIGRPRLDVDVDQLKELRERGLSWAEIQRQSGVCRSTAQRALAETR